MDDLALWQQTLSLLTQKISTLHLQMFFRHARLTRGSSDIIELRVGSAYAQQIISQRYLSTIKEVLQMLIGKTPHVRILVDQSVVPAKTQAEDHPFFQPSSSPTTAPKNTLLQKDFTFENFAVASSNQLANAAALAVAKNPGGAYNPLFLYGPVGVGKTHLMHAIGNVVFARNSHVRLVCCTGEEFMNDLILSIQTKSTGMFKRRYRNAELFMVDDVQFIAGKNVAQEEFFNTFNSLMRAGSQIILTADHAPGEIQKLEARLRSRFEAGMIADLLPPDFELRTAILLIKAKAFKLSIDMQTAQAIAGRAKNVRQMEGILTKLTAIAAMKNTPITLDLVNEHIRIQQEEEERKIGPEKIIDAVLSFYHLTPDQLRDKKRDRLLVRPRQIIMYLLRKEIKLTYTHIGHFLGKRDHSTIIHGVEKIESLIQKDVSVGGDIARIKQRVWG